ncbi:glycosyltransferase family 2 protein [Nanoarchaeota archaeon]
MKFFSVIVLNWNGKKYLKDCFSSIKRQSFQDFEAILVDNNSDDGSVEYVKKKFPFVKIVQNDDNYGFAKGNNIGIAKAKGKWVFILNNDTKLDKHCLEQAKKVIDAHKGTLGMVGPKMIYFDTLKVDTIGLNILKSGLGADAKKYNKRIIGPCGGAGFYKKEMLADVKEGKGDYFDSDFFIYCEDYDLALRGFRKGWAYAYSPGSVVHHVHSATMRKESKKAVFLQQRNLKLALVKNMPLGFLLRNSIWILYTHLLVSGMWCLRRRPLIVLKYNIDIILKLPRYIRKRRKTVQTITSQDFNKAVLDRLY